MNGKPFILYIAMKAHALAELLAQQDDDGKEHPMYYISPTLIDFEKFHTIEKKI
jgi:hypothetical protein